MANQIGIDLGTSLSVISCFRDNGTAEVLYVLNEERLLPSVVHFSKSTGSLKTHVGTAAREALQYDGKNVVFQVKSNMGTDTDLGTPNSGPKSPVEISSIILKELLKTAEEKLGEKIDVATITVPANWLDNKKNATKEAGLLAGLKNVYIINEPTSAALFYSLQQRKEGKLIVYDIGGGTFDITVLEIIGHDMNVIANEGAKIGGIDFDWKLFEIINKKYFDEKGVNIYEDTPEVLKCINDTIVPSKFQGDVESFKHALSSQEVRKGTIYKAPKRPYDCTVSRDEFEAAISEYVAKTEILLDATLEQANLTVDDIDEVILVGGSTRIPCFKNSITNFFKMEPANVLNVDEVVSLGASVNTALREESTLTDQQKEVLQNISFTDVANHFLGVFSRISIEQIRAETGNQDYDGPPLLTNSVIIHKNTPIPCKESKMFMLSKDNIELGEIGVTLTQSNINSVDPEDVKGVKKTSCTFFDGMKEKDFVEVIYEIDQDQLLVCNIKHLKTGKIMGKMEHRMG